MPATMAKALPIKTKRQCTAAYAASQPLFDQLRTGVERVGDQRAHLQMARSTVQKLHVKLPSSSVADDVRDGHEKYMDGAVQAWRLATESYAGIFEALADVTAAEPSAGRAKSEGHEAFVKMASTARDAHEAAMDWELTTPRSSAERDARGGQSGDEDEDMEDASESQSAAPRGQGEAGATATSGKEAPAAERDAQPADDRPTNPILMSLLKKQPDVEVELDKGQQKSAAADGSERPSVPEATTGASGKDTGRALKRLEKRRKRKEKRTVKQAQERETGTEQAKSPARNIGRASEGESKPAKPQYEDVSAEVAARLKAKDVKKDTVKEKKRKRDSRDSLQNGEPDVKQEKPSKKKAKSNGGEVIVDAVAAEKARKHTREAGEGGEEARVEGRKKRKKA